MLSASNSQFRSARVNECILRRKTRNLRAKVRALLPVEICCKHDRRNRGVKQIEQNKQNWMKEREEKAVRCRCYWNNSREKQSELYFETTTEGELQQIFMKLSDAEIDQIRQDKLYYLGEDNLKPFQQFLLDREHKKKMLKTLNNITLTSKTSPASQVKGGVSLLKNMKTSSQQNLSPDSSRFTRVQNSRQNTDRFVMRSEKGQRNQVTTQKFYQFQMRRKMILIEERSKGIMNKVKTNIKAQRAISNFAKIKDKHREQIQKKLEAVDQRMKKVRTTKKNMRQRGQIIRLEEELRRTFMAKRFKTSQDSDATPCF